MLSANLMRTMKPFGENDKMAEFMEVDMKTDSKKRDLEYDCRSFEEPIKLTPTELRQQLIDISDEFTDSEFADLKFFLFDYIPVAKLEKADSALDLFEMMKKVLMFDESNLDIILEILARIHRYDLVRKLGFDVDYVKEKIPQMSKIYPFRILEMELAEDLEDKEFQTLKFLLAANIKKRKLENLTTVCDLLIFLEKEGLISADKPEMLISLMQGIKRPDLEDKVRKYVGQKVCSVPSNLRRGAEASAAVGRNPATSQEMHRARNGPSNGYPCNSQTNVEQLQAMANTVGGVPDQNANSAGNNFGGKTPIDRSASAGTISISEGSESETENSIGELPTDLYNLMCNELKDKFNDLGSSLGYSQDILDNFRIQYPDDRLRTECLLRSWQNSREDKGEIIPGLIFALKQLGCKRSAEGLHKWVMSHDRPLPGAGAANATTNENIYLSLQSAQPYQVGMQNAAANQPNVGGGHIMNGNALGVAPQRNVMGDAAVRQLQGQMQQLTVGGQSPAQQAVPTNPQVPAQAPGQGASNMLAQPPVQAPVGAVPQLAPQQVVRGTQILSVDELPSYPMTKRPRGWCVIINNEKFYVDDAQGKQMPPRIGTAKDAESLTVVFEQQLNFIVRRYDNLTDTEMMQTMVDVAHNVDHSGFDCLVVCILTHGVQNNLFGVNGRLVSIKDITSNFQANRCPSLRGKPKLFFLQACQGRDKMEGAEIEKDGPTPIPPENETETDTREMDFIPNEADFLLGYATVPGYVSFRSRTYGSWYIRKLCELLQKYYKRYDLMRILTEVNRQVAQGDAKMDGGLYKQIPAPFFTLRKKLQFSHAGAP